MYIFINYTNSVWKADAHQLIQAISQENHALRQPIQTRQSVLGELCLLEKTRQSSPEQAGFVWLSCPFAVWGSPLRPVAYRALSVGCSLIRNDMLLQAYAAPRTIVLTSLHLFLMTFLKKTLPASLTPLFCAASNTSTRRCGRNEGCTLISPRLCSACFRVVGAKDASNNEGRSDMLTKWLQNTTRVGAGLNRAYQITCAFIPQGVYATFAP